MLPTNGLSIKRLTVKRLAGEPKATEVKLMGSSRGCSGARMAALAAGHEAPAASGRVWQLWPFWARGEGEAMAGFPPAISVKSCWL